MGGGDFPWWPKLEAEMMRAHSWGTWTTAWTFCLLREERNWRESAQQAKPGPSAARNAQALRSYTDDEDLPVITLSVPYPFGAPTDLIPTDLAPEADESGVGRPCPERAWKSADAALVVKASDPVNGGTNSACAERARKSADAALVVTASDPAEKKDGDADIEGEEAPKTPAKSPAPGPAVVPSPLPRKRPKSARENDVDDRKRPGGGDNEGEEAPKTSAKVTSDVEVRGISNMGADGGVLSAIPVTPTKFWTCSGYYCRNFDFSARLCNMCRFAKDPAARYQNPNAVFLVQDRASATRGEKV